MGRRASRHRFVPGSYVFPGGAIDAADHRAQCLSPLLPAVEKKLLSSCPPSKARALAVAAVRETHEETGLMLGELRNGRLLPALQPLDYVMRAITPAQSPIRFHARFFMADASHAAGTLKGNGELLDLAWRPLREALKLPLVDVTQYLLERLAVGLRAGPGGEVPLFRFRKGRALVR